MAAGAVLMSAGASAAMVRGLYPALALISIATFGYSSWAANVLTLPADLLPAGTVGSAVGLSGTAAGAGGTLVTLATGAVVDHFGYSSAFWFPAVLPALALLPIAWLVRRRANSCDGAAIV
jgi:ACS family hexuronate transporter-like MFS transporter